MNYNTNEIYSVDADGRVFSGYDMPERGYHARPEDADDEAAAVAEKLALADAMIARWQAYKDKVTV